jgi:hypothetical protein
MVLVGSAHPTKYLASLNIQGWIEARETQQPQRLRIDRLTIVGYRYIFVRVRSILVRLGFAALCLVRYPTYIFAKFEI